MKIRKLLTTAGAPLLGLSLLCGSCAIQKPEAALTTLKGTSVQVERETINTLLAQTGQAANVYANLYALVKTQEEIDKQNKNFLPEFEDKTYNNLTSLDAYTVLIQKPEDGEFDKDLYVRRIQIQDKLESIVAKTPLPAQIKTPDAEIEESTANPEETSPEIPKTSTPKKENVLVWPYAIHKTEGEISEDDYTTEGQNYKIDSETGKIEILTDWNKKKFYNLWEPGDAFGVYKVNEDGTVESENLLEEQDLKVTQDGSIVLKTKKLGENPEGKYRIKAVVKYKKKTEEVKAVEDIRDATSLEQIKMFTHVGMAKGSLTHIYSGPDPTKQGSKGSISLVLSNYHVYNEAVEIGKVKNIPGDKEGVIRGMYVSLGAQPLVKFDERVDGEWLVAELFRYKKDLDAMVLNLEHPIKDKSLPKAKFAKCDPQRGEQALFVGHPLGMLRKQIYVDAWISDSKNHDVGEDSMDMTSFYGGLIGGNSGGGLYNTEGELLGITSAGYVTIGRVIESEAETLESLKELESLFKDEAVFEKVKDKLFSAALKHPDVKEITKNINDENYVKEVAKELSMIHAKSTYDSSSNSSSDKRVKIVLHPTLLDLARKGTRVQEWFWQIGIDIGQQRIYDWSGNNSDEINKCGTYSK
ncbi:MAG: trypsin-like peptidase domain-containing protein [Candidatus Woesearchaeota archaeon]